ncbi:hypothetical protein SCHPADRAFT_1002848 [Schizopora paradoxa]|uniref:F-box domain-containing protein n=1 Tax=Schizopora paradoxa TaxID=27342 RepID=A0A0H2R1C8_9AGAM|nr:hypothetical protein SCHPADRAFT_1002848 [Schizopora paradoxa]
MTPVVDLPDEILCNVISLAIKNWRIFPKVFKAGNDFQDCVALIDVSRVCRRWREAAITDPTLWSSLCIVLHTPSAEVLRQLAYFVDICSARSKDLPMTIAVSIMHLDDLRLAHPLMRSIVAQEHRWSRIAINVIRPREQEDRMPIRVNEPSTNYDINLSAAGGDLLKEFQFNIGAWFTYSLNGPLPALETLKVAGYKIDGAAYILAKWSPFAPNLTELEMTVDASQFTFSTAEREINICGEEGGSSEQRFLLPKLRTLTVLPSFLPNLTCPNLEKYIMGSIPGGYSHLLCFLEFIDRNAPPLRTLAVRDGSSFLDNDMVRLYLTPTITTVIVKGPLDGFFSILSKSSPGGAGVLVLPALEQIELYECYTKYLDQLSALVLFRWDTSNRTLKSVKLCRCFQSMPEALMRPGNADIDVAEVEERWQGIARPFYVNFGSAKK